VKLKAAILDWAGTMVDHGSLAPVAAMRSVFASFGVEVTTEEIRASMGLPKKDHLRAILAARHSAADIEELYAAFIPRQMESLAEHAEVIAGVATALDRMRCRGLKIGSTTGYNRAMLDDLIPRARSQGCAPDCAVCPDDVGGGRPMPWMCYHVATILHEYPLWAMVKIGDTESDIAEGRNAGMWTIAVARTGNEVGLSEGEWDAMPVDRRTALLSTARERLCTADYVVDSVAEAEPALDDIEERLARGQRPS
jgi:phosphonoacetaldehyde hydrolase